MNVLLLLIFTGAVITAAPFAAITVRDLKNEIIELYKGGEKVIYIILVLLLPFMVILSACK